MNFAPIPNYIWAQIISYLPWDERIRIELVNKQFKKASKLSWRHQRKIDIDDRFNSSAKVWMLLKRCGSELEEISALRCLPQMPGHLGHICPKLKCLSFRSGATISFADRTAYWQQGFRTEIYRIFRSFGRLQRLEYFHPEKYCKYGDISLSTAGKYL